VTENVNNQHAVVPMDIARPRIDRGYSSDNSSHKTGPKEISKKPIYRNKLPAEEYEMADGTEVYPVLLAITQPMHLQHNT
jgi:hypothetical protein